MCAGIMDLSNALIYGDRLQCGSPDVKSAKLNLLEPGSMTVWLKEVIALIRAYFLVSSSVS